MALINFYQKGDSFVLGDKTIPKGSVMIKQHDDDLIEALYVNTNTAIEHGYYSEFCDVNGDAYTSLQALLNAINATYTNDMIIGQNGIKFYNSVSGLYMRMIIRNGSLMQDRELTTLGFNGVENTDWENIGGSI